MGLFSAFLVGSAIQLGWKALLAIGEYEDLKSVREYEEKEELVETYKKE